MSLKRLYENFRKNPFRFAASLAFFIIGFTCVSVGFQVLRYAGVVVTNRDIITFTSLGMLLEGVGFLVIRAGFEL